MDLPDQRLDHRIAFSAIQFDEDHESRLALNKRGDAGVLGAVEKIAFPMAWNGPILDLRRALSDRGGSGFM